MGGAKNLLAENSPERFCAEFCAGAHVGEPKSPTLPGNPADPATPSRQFAADDRGGGDEITLPQGQAHLPRFTAARLRLSIPDNWAADFTGWFTGFFSRID